MPFSAAALLAAAVARNRPAAGVADHQVDGKPTHSGPAGTITISASARAVILRTTAIGVPLSVGAGWAHGWSLPAHFHPRLPTTTGNPILR